MQQLRGAGWEPPGSESSLSVCVSAFCSWMMGVWVPCDVTEGAGCLGCRPMAFIRPMSLSGLRPERLALKQPRIANKTIPFTRFEGKRPCCCPGCHDDSIGSSYPDLSEPRVRLVPPLLTENKGSPLASAGLSPSLR